MRLKGYVSIVTGGGFGIGRAYSVGLAAQGSKVVVADLNDEGARATCEEIRDLGGEAIAVHAGDCSNPAPISWFRWPDLVK